jgi:ABC-2 type transport system permease protein/sodium transport system permease protein
VVFVTDDLKKALRDGAIDLAVWFENPRQFHACPDRDLAVNGEVNFITGSTRAQEALTLFERRLNDFNAHFLQRRLLRVDVRQRALPVRITLEAIGASADHGAVSLAAVVPLVLILMTITGAVYPAIDLTAGERERGTLEVLVAAPIPRFGLLCAKYAAVLVVALLTAVMNLTMMTASLLASGLGPQVLGKAGLSIRLMSEVLGLLLLFAAFFSAMLLIVTSFARSFKEAQAYLIPMMLLSMAPGMAALLPGLDLSGPCAVAPLLNIVLLTRDLIEGKAALGPALIVVVATLLYAASALAVAARIFGAEAVLYSDQRGWADLLRRPTSWTLVPTVMSALLCLALIFPLVFFLKAILAYSQSTLNLPQGTLLGVMALTTVVLFAGLPAAAARLGRIQLSSALMLRRPTVTSLVGAILLGLSLWALCHAVLVFLGTSVSSAQWAQSQSLREQIDAYLRGLRTVPPLIVILCVGVAPAIAEELFFRGYLFSALRGQLEKWATIATTAVIFGCFHLATAELFGLERLLVTSALGFVLGWVCWETDTVIPGMALHACHNSVLAMGGYYRDELRQWGLDVDGPVQLPVLVVGLALAASVLGTGLIRLARRKAESS